MPPRLESPSNRLSRSSRDRLRVLRNSGDKLATPRGTAVSIDDFSLHETIGAGGFGVVLRASKSSSCKKAYLQDNLNFAVKVVDKTRLKDDGRKQQRRLWTERTVLINNSHHSFIVSLLFTFQSRCHLFLVFEALEGGSLHYHIYRPRLRPFCPPASGFSSGFDVECTRFYAAELLVAIAHLHRHGVVHRDIKPGNIMLDTSGHLRLIDFGCAAETNVNLDSQPDAETKQMVSLCGTMDYLTPEALRGEGYAKGVDWWAFAVTVYEIHTGQLPFNHANPATKDDVLARAQTIHEGLPLAPSPSIDDGLFDLANACLQLRPNRRLGNVANATTAIKKLPFFAGTSWQRVGAMQATPLYEPSVARPRVWSGDKDFEFVSTRCRDVTPQRALETARAPQPGDSMTNVFTDFEYQPSFASRLREGSKDDLDASMAEDILAARTIANRGARPLSVAPSSPKFSPSSSPKFSPAGNGTAGDSQNNDADFFSRFTQPWQKTSTDSGDPELLGSSHDTPLQGKEDEGFLGSFFSFILCAASGGPPASRTGEAKR